MSKGKSGFAIRMCILVGLLVIVGGGYWYDVNYKIEANLEAMDRDVAKVQGLSSKKGGTSPVGKEEVHEAMGKKPSKTEKTPSGKYEIETFNYSRTLPFIPGEKVYAAYVVGGPLDGRLARISMEPITDEILKGSLKENELDPNNMPGMGMGGGPPRQTPPPAEDKADEDKADETKKDEDKKDDGDAGKSDDGKSDDGKSGDGQSGDGQSGDGV